MASKPNNQSQHPLFGAGLQRTKPGRIATRIGDLVCALIVIIFWVVVLCAALAAGYVAVRAILFVIMLASDALGL